MTYKYTCFSYLVLHISSIVGHCSTAYHHSPAWKRSECVAATGGGRQAAGSKTALMETKPYTSQTSQTTLTVYTTVWNQHPIPSHCVVHLL
jgi:hypothetical protein